MPHRITPVYEVGTLAVDGWVVTFGTARRGLAPTGPGHSPRRSLLAVPNVTAHPSTASVPITVHCPLLCGFNMAIKALKY